MQNKMTSERKSLEQYLSLSYSIVLHADPDGGFVGEVRELPGCMSQGETAEEALRMLDDARQAWLRAAYASGGAIPEPAQPVDYSGKFLCRIPKSLHKHLAEAADEEGVSLNQLVVSMLSGQHAALIVRQECRALHQQMSNVTAFTVGRLRASMSSRYEYDDDPAFHRSSLPTIPMAS